MRKPSFKKPSKEIDHDPPSVESPSEHDEEQHDEEPGFSTAERKLESTVDRLEAYGKQLAANETGASTDEPQQANSTSESREHSPHSNDQLIHETRSQIRSLVQEISELAQTECELDEFLSGFLNRVTSALASVGGAIWLLREAGQLEFSYGVNVPSEVRSDDQARNQHHALLGQLFDRAEPALVPPGSGTANIEQAANPTNHLLVVAPLIVDQEPIGVVEIFQRSGTGPTTQRGYVRFLVQMAAIASDFFKNQRLRSIREQHQLWSKLESLIHSLHRSLDRKTTAYTLANEGRRVLGCERVSVAMVRGRRCRIEAVSGLDSLDRRATDLKQLGKLATRVAITDEPLWYDGNTEDLPPQLDALLQAYLERSHTKWMGIIPLTTPELSTSDDDEENTEPGDLLGALIVEQIGDSSETKRLQQQSMVVAQHASDAFANIKRVDSIPFSAVWKTLAKLSWLSEARALPLSVGLPAILVAAVVALCIIPYDFEVGSEGTLTPANRQVVFAPAESTVSQLYLSGDPNQIIPQGTLIAELSDRDLDAAIGDLESKERELRVRYATTERMLGEQIHELTQREQIQLSGDLTETEQEFYRVQRSLAEKRLQKEQLLIHAPLTGLVGDWQVRERLYRRPVQRGQALMTFVDPDGDWEVELELPEDNVGHLMQAMKDSDEPPEVSFLLFSEASQTIRGRVKKIHSIAEVRETDQNVVLVKVSFDKNQIDPELLRFGTRVRARIDCGKRPIGYVLFHDVIEAAQSRILFWL